MRPEVGSLEPTLLRFLQLHQSGHDLLMPELGHGPRRSVRTCEHEVVIVTSTDPSELRYRHPRPQPRALLLIDATPSISHIGRTRHSGDTSVCWLSVLMDNLSVAYAAAI